jgi:hypothetical protein
MKKKLKKMYTAIKKMKINASLKPCPFCGSKDLHGWAHISDSKDPTSFDYKCKGREMQITCEWCGMAVTFGWFGSGISDKQMIKMSEEHWNRRK